MIDDELIQRFFDDRCTSEEAALVADYLQVHPEVLERYMPEKEFVQMNEEEDLLQEERDLPGTVSAQWLANIRREARAGGEPIRRIWGKRLAAAAVMAGAIWGATFLFHGRHGTPLAG